MQIKGRNLCDFCFEPITPGTVCPKCGLTHSTYRTDVGLLSPGTNLMGKYIIGRALGRGGFGATYLAYSASLGRAVAIKEYFPISIVCRGKDNESVVVLTEANKETFKKGANRFFEEAKTISRFNAHPNIVSVYEFFYANGTVYYSMEYLDGVDLKKYVKARGGRLSEAEALGIMRSICNALAAVHSTNTLHRDIAPDNIFICSNGNVKLIDFGAAKQVVAAEQQSFSVVVKQGFAPAEQYSKKGKQGTWSDIYALGASTYYALTGIVPVDAIDRIENPALKFDLKSEHSSEIFMMIHKCMAPGISDRYQTATELLWDLNRIKVGANNPGNQKPNMLGTAVKGKPRNLALKIALIAACLVLVAVSAWGAYEFLLKDSPGFETSGSGGSHIAVSGENSEMREIKRITIYDKSGYTVEHPVPAYIKNNLLYISVDRLMVHFGYPVSFAKDDTERVYPIYKNKNGRIIKIKKGGREFWVTERDGGNATVNWLSGSTFNVGAETYVPIRSFLAGFGDYPDEKIVWDAERNILYFSK